MRTMWTLFLLCCWTTVAVAQDATLVLSTQMFSADQRINLSEQKGWIFHAGNNPAWSSPNLNIKNWVNRQPTSLSVNDADATGRVEGWFRINIQLDSSFSGIPVWLKKSTWAAADLYVDGQLLTSYGSTGVGGKHYKAYNPWNKLPMPVRLAPQQVHCIAIHVVDYRAPIWSGKLKSNIEPGLNQFLQLTGPDFLVNFTKSLKANVVVTTLWVAVSLIIALFLWLLSAQQLESRSIFRLLAMQASFASLFGLGYFLRTDEMLSFMTETIIHHLADFCLSISGIFLPIVLLHLVKHPLARQLTMPLLVFVGVASLLTVFMGLTVIGLVSDLVQVVLLLYGIVVAWKRVQGAQWAIVIGLLLAFVFILSFDFVLENIPEDAVSRSNPASRFLITAYFLCIPLSFLVYVALRFKEILTEVKTNADAVVAVTEEKRQLLATENERLEQQVEAGTAELKASQAQLIQKEKLASLGELTAGIAHEIQNPLNFVNNFSEVSTELVDELKEGPFQKLPDSEKEYADEILGDLTQNLQKITHHGGRASSIVKGMLEHSRTTTGERQPTDLNALADEYLRLAYQGLRAKDKTFNCELTTDFDSALPPVTVVSQEIGRVLLNLFNNAFYAVQQRTKTATTDYQPSVRVSTQRQGDRVEIRVSDNGTGIPDVVKAKIFQPFFTTKPTGEGTGLGLSLSYDIITKGHGGTLEVESDVGRETTFIVKLPLV